MNFARLPGCELVVGLAALALALPLALDAQPMGGLGGGFPIPAHRCPGALNPQQELDVRRELEQYQLRQPGRDAAIPAQAASPRLFPFYPQAGIPWQDIFPVNFVDLDPTTGRRDYNGTTRTYDGHTGIDTDLSTFAFQDAGVPVYAVLDGTVVTTHDGEYDRNTTWAGQPANYVVLDHGGGLTTRYYHLRNNSVAVLPGQIVKAGQQLGQTGSSGISTGPHLHFETRQDGVVVEPFAGAFRAGPSLWKNQVPFRTDTYLREFAFTGDSLANWYYLSDSNRTGTVVAGTQTISFWIVVGNIPLASTNRLRFIRPDSSVAFDTGTNSLNNAEAYPVSYWWWWYTLDFNQTGTWKLELSLNGTGLITAPFTVVASAAAVVNRPPHAVQVAFQSTVITPADVVVCRVQNPTLLDDPDYDLVRYQWVWRRNGTIVRDVTTAAWTDVLPHDVVVAGDTLTCAVTPRDASAAGPESLASVQIAAPPAIATQPKNATPNVGTAVTFTVTATGTPPFTYQWQKNDTAIAGATAASYTIPNVQDADGGSYAVQVSSPAGTVLSNAATLTPIPAGIVGTQALAAPGYVPGTPLTISNTIQHRGTASGLGWQVLLPSGWTFLSDAGTSANSRPAAGQAGLLVWTWTAVPPSPVTFTYTVNIPADAAGSRELAALLIVRQDPASPLQVIVRPDPLVVAPVVPHSADVDRNFRLSLPELARVLALYQTRRGTTRTGCYRVDAAGEDGFTVDPSRAGPDPVTLARYHSADTNRDGRLGLAELTRVIEYYQYRIGTLRTGQYHPDAGGEDGFAPGP